MRELLRHRDFRLLLAGQTLSMFGDWTLLLVFGIWAKTLTGSNAIAGLTIFAMAAPGLLGPFAGVLVDRLPRRAVLIGLNLASAVVVASLLLVQGRDQLWLLFAVAVWYGFSGVMFNAALSGLLQAMLPGELLGQANGALVTIRQALRLVGPLVGAGLFAAFGGRAVATLDAITFLLSTVFLVLLRHRETPPLRGPDALGAQPFRAELLAGLAHLWRSPLLRRLSVTTIVFSASIGMLEPTVYALVGDGLHRSPGFVGVLASIQGVGAIIGGIAVSAAIRRVAEPALIVAGLALVGLGAGLATIPALPFVLAGFVLLGAGLPTLSVAVATMLQRTTPNAMMGRVAAGYDMVGTVPTTASIALGAVLVAVVSYQVIFVVCAVGCLLAAAWMLLGRGRADGSADADPIIEEWRTSSSPARPTASAGSPQEPCSARAIRSPCTSATMSDGRRSRSWWTAARPSWSAIWPIRRRPDRLRSRRTSSVASTR